MSITDKINCVNDKFKLLKQIGSGTFGDIYLGIDQITEELVSIKFEDGIKYQGESQLKKEAKFYVNLKYGTGIPQLKWFGQEKDYNILVMDNLGPNLEQLYNKCNRKFSLKTVLSIADQLLVRIEFLHSNNIIHRDVKPENFCIGLKKKSDQIYMIDLGISKKFMDIRTGMHIPFVQNQELSGSTKFSSISAHFGIDQSRRDDLESLGYILIYFLRGDLPWMNQYLSKDITSIEECLENIRNIKLNTNSNELCQGLKEEFSLYMDYVKNLKFEEKPDYIYLKTMFNDLFQKNFDKQDWIFDWAIHQQNI